jgi:hypothetical protein
VKRSSALIGALLLIAVLGALDVFVWFADFWLPVESRTALTIQDRVGSAAALFSALAFAAVLYTVWLQKQELELQRQELAETREELRGQKEQLILQNATLARQSFEGTFFHMVTLHNDIVTSQRLRLSEDGPELEGRQGLAAAAQELVTRLAYVNVTGPDGTVDVARLYDVYRNVCHTRTCDLTHYFRNLYHLLRFVDDSVFEEPEKRRYAQVVRAQLSAAENVLILFNGLRKTGASRFKRLIERYRLLNELPDYDVLIDAKSMYEPSAFGSSRVDGSARRAAI